MKIHRNIKKRSGFTLIELLTVIAIIGILAGILLPVVGVVRKTASKATAASNLRQIATAYVIFAEGGPRPRSISLGAWALGGTTASNTAEWGQVVAQFGGLNEGPLYFVPNDGAVAALGVLPATILDTDADTGVRAVNTNWNANAAISYAAITGFSPTVRSTIMPLIWTKGIVPGSSTWLPSSPWGDDGGHIAFLDTHVTFYNTLVGELNDQNGTTVDNITLSLTGTNTSVGNIVDAPSGG